MKSPIAWRLRWLGILAGLAFPAGAQPPQKVWSYYHDHARLSRDLQDLQRTFPEIVKLESIGRSVQGREIWLVTIAKGGRRGQPQVLFDGAMHGSEVIGAESLLSYA